MERKRHIVHTAFWVGDRVYRRTDPLNEPGLVIEVRMLPDNGVRYSASFSGFDGVYFEIELDSEKCFSPDGEDSEGNTLTKEPDHE